ncbi:MAG TPA: oxidoreductase, partial [Anaeromyxobacteraceae bacterium]|nr:oxidoreductase [Anaeromyxobacteraceae bacterium]
MARRTQVGPEGLDAEIAAALKALRRVAEDRSVLAHVDAETREALQRLAGEVARPAHEHRRSLRKALLRKGRDRTRARDGRLRGETGIRKLRSAPVFETPLPELPAPGTDA